MILCCTYIVLIQTAVMNPAKTLFRIVFGQTPQFFHSNFLSSHYNPATDNILGGSRLLQSKILKYQTQHDYNAINDVIILLYCSIIIIFLINIVLRLQVITYYIICNELYYVCAVMGSVEDKIIKYSFVRGRKCTTTPSEFTMIITYFVPNINIYNALHNNVSLS